ncbi:MAG: hypothetical protein R8K46_02920 [Mariprofundaceae bacterium]
MEITNIASKLLRFGFAIAVVLVWSGNNANAGLSEMGKYDSCVAVHAKDVKATWLKPLMERSCRAKFPEPGEEDASVNIDYYGCILERLPEIDSMLAISGVQSTCKQAHGPKRKPGVETMKNAGEDQGLVLLLEQAGQYVYLQVDHGGEKVWIAGIADVHVGNTVRWSNPTPMKDYHSKTLNRTFDKVLFVGVLKVIK